MPTRIIEHAPAPDNAALTAVLDGLPLGVAVLDQDRRIVFTNSALEALTGLAAETAKGLPCRHALRCGAHAGSCPQPPGPGLPPRGLETDIIDRARRKIPVRVTPVEIRNATGEPVFWLEVFEDLRPLREMERRLADASGAGELISRGQAMERVKRILPAIAQSDLPVLLTGETGTGKDLAAQVIHKASPRAFGPFVRVNLGPMPEHLLEADLYGRVSETGEAQPGSFQRAGGGTLYLSEIADLPPGFQAGLVRFLDDQTVMPAGSDKSVRLSVRLLAATHRDPEELVRSGALREDLFHRLSSLRVHLPPLRERCEDLEFLLLHFLEVFAARFKKTIKGFSPRALAFLRRHAYPGNVRELRNIVEYAAMVCHKDLILPAHLPAHLIGAGMPPVCPPPASPASGTRSGAAAAESGRGRAKAQSACARKKS